MVAITAKMVAELRELTGMGMMECKKALVETAGDIKAAEEALRIKSGNKASKMAGRTAAEGVIASFISEDGQTGVLVEVNCETDFVAKDANFVAFAQSVAEAIASNAVVDIEAVSALPVVAGGTVEDARKAAISKLGENMSVRRFVRFNTDGKVAAYLHGAKIGVLVDLVGGEAALGRDIAMHIAASKPICVSKEQVSAELLENERKIFVAQAAESGKPADIVARMVEGRVAKYLAEVTLVGQAFVKNPDQTIAQLLASQKASVNAFQMFVVGEGIEKKVIDFAAEVAAAAQV